MSIFQQDAFFWRLIQLVRSLSTQTDHWQLYSDLLDECQNITHCDGATLYVLSTDETGSYLKYALVQNTSLQLCHKYRDLNESALPPIRIHSSDASKTQTRSIAAHCALEGKAICVEDVYRTPLYNTSGIKAFDDLFNYRTRSVLSVPVTRPGGEVLGVIQLINPQNPLCGTAAHYSDSQITIIESMSALLATLLEKEKADHAENSLLVRLSNKGHQEPVFERVLNEALSITGADGASIYWLKQDEQMTRLELAIMKNKSLGLNQAYSEEKPLNLHPLLLEKEGNPNLHNLATYTAITKHLINIDDAYNNTQFNFSGMKAFDEHYRYHSQSFLCAPLLTQQDDVIGVLQLINAKDPVSQKTIPFNPRLEPIIMALASYAALALENNLLHSSRIPITNPSSLCQNRAS